MVVHGFKLEELNFNRFKAKKGLDEVDVFINSVLGAVLNRFSKDMNQVDELLPLTILDVLFVSTFLKYTIINMSPDFKRWNLHLLADFCSQVFYSILKRKNEINCRKF